MLSNLLRLAAVLCVCQAAAARPAQPPLLEDLAFMSGCWEGPFSRRGRTGVIEEHYTHPSASPMLGATRYLSKGKQTSWTARTCGWPASMADPTTPAAANGG